MSRPLLALSVAVLALSYPLWLLAGGAPRFPSRGDCARPATSTGEIVAVFGTFDSEQRARVLRDRALRAGFQGTGTEWSSCGRVEVVVRGIPSLEVGRELAREARSVGLEVTLQDAG